MVRFVTLAALLLIAGCSRVGVTTEEDAPATVGSVSRPTLVLVDWMDTVCGVGNWLETAQATGRTVRTDSEATDYLTTAVIRVDMRLAELAALGDTHTDADTVADTMRTALERLRPALTPLTAGAEALPLEDKLARAAAVAEQLAEIPDPDPLLEDVLTTDPALSAAHEMADSCTT